MSIVSKLNGIVFGSGGPTRPRDVREITSGDMTEEDSSRRILSVVNRTYTVLPFVVFFFEGFGGMQIQRWTSLISGSPSDRL